MQKQIFTLLWTPAKYVILINCQNHNILLIAGIWKEVKPEPMYIKDNFVIYVNSQLINEHLENYLWNL